MKQTYDIDVPVSVSVCDNCCEINKTLMEYELRSIHLNDKYDQVFSNMLKEYSIELGRPRLNWEIYKPHVCTLDRLRQIQEFYLNNWISKELFDEWMAINGGEYQLGLSGRINHFWSERLLIIKSDNLLDKPELKDSIYNILKGSRISTVGCSHHGSKHIVHGCVIKGNNKTRDMFRPLNDLYPFSSDADKIKTNVDLASLVLFAVQAKKIDVVNKALTLVPVGSFNSVATAMLIHALGNKVFDKMYDMIHRDKACCLKPTAFNKYLKAITTAIRRTSNWPDGTSATLEEVSNAAYWEMCIGRAHMQSNWEEEKYNRTQQILNLKMPATEIADSESNKEYLRHFAVSLDEIMLQLIPGQPYTTSWREFCLSRQSWLSSGSSGGQSLIIDDKRIRINKRTYFENVPIDENIAWLNQEPIMIATASEKFEQSKARAIYGTKPMDYAIMTYAIQIFEATLHKVDGLEGGLMGADEMRSVLRRMNMFAEDKFEGLMIDYADFNIQHTLQAQAEVFWAMSRRMQLLGIEPDMIRACNWCADACLNQWVKFPNDENLYRSIQGLFSGNRGTNFINTLCNLAYFKTANRWVEQNLDIKPIQLYNLHQGDDVWITNKSRLWGMALYLVMKDTGFVFQKEKQLQDINRGEFLRVLYSTEGAMGYLARSVGTLITRPLQSEDDVSPEARVAGLNSQVMILYRRGLSIEACKIVWDATVKHALTSKLPLGSTVTLPIAALQRNYLDGGLDLGPPGTMCERGKPVAPMPAIQLQSRELYDNVQRNTSDAWVQVVSEKYKQTIDAHALSDMIHKINVSDSIPSVDKIRCLAKHHKALQKWIRSISPIVPVPRTYDILERWLGRRVVIDKFLVEAVNYQIMILKVKIDAADRGMIDTIISAVSSSPFKDIASAVRSLHLGIVAATREAVKFSKSDKLAGESLHIMDELERFTSRDILARILSGVRGIGPTFEALLHPIMLSWTMKLATEFAIRHAIAIKLRSIPQWDELLYTWQEMGVKCILSYDMFRRVSHY